MMTLIKKFFYVAIMLMPMAGGADTPATACPTGYITAISTSAILANDSCPSGYKEIATVTSCLVAAPDGTCAMFVPADVLWNDAAGAYKYKDMCVLE